MSPKSLKNFLFSFRHLPLKPTININGNITHLTLETLREHDIKGLILDLDNTLIIPKMGEMFAEVETWLRDIQSAGIKTIVLTNNNKINYLNHVETVLNQIPVKMLIEGYKPCPKKINQAIDYLGLLPSEVAVVGDRVLTDIWGAYNANTKSILLKPLIGDAERPLYRFLRKIEYGFLRG